MYRLLPILLFAYGLAITTEDIYDNSWALIIGIDKYENVRSLDYAVKDAEDIRFMLVNKFNFKQDNIVLLKDEEATKTAIIQEFSNITKKAGANDRILIFFAGHGETEDLPDGGEMGYLLPVDANDDLYLSSIEMDEMKTISLRSEAKHILYLVDACYGGLVSVGSRGLDAKSTPNYLQKITQYKSRQIISAGGRGEQVIEKAEWGHSAFTKNLLSGLRDWMADTDSDGIITVQELGTYLKKKVTIDSNNQQTPKTRNLTTDEGEFVFFRYNDGVENLDDLPNSKKENAQEKLMTSFKRWEYIRDRSRYFVSSMDAIGIGGDKDRFLNDGKTAFSDGFEILAQHDMKHNYILQITPRLTLKHYLNPFSDYFIYYGAALNVFIGDFKRETIDVTYGFEPLIGLGNIDLEPIGILSNFFPNLIFKGEIGYRIIPENSKFAVQSGIDFSMKIGSFKRKYSDRNKILPE